MRMNKTASSAWSIMALFAASMATSCSSDSLVTDGNADGGEGKSVTLTAKVNDSEAATRVGMNNESDDEVSFYWHQGDEILVQTVSGGTYSGAKFTTATKTGEASAEFTGTVESGNSLGTYAVYPYNKNHEFTSATALKYNLPAEYSYTTVESGIFSKTDGTGTTYRSTSANIPMVGTIAENTIEFKHIGGLAVIRIDEMPVTEGTLTVTADQQLCGDFTISDLSADGAAIKTSTSAATTDNKTVTFSFSGATTNEVGVFYLPLATGSYSGLKIEFGDATNTYTVNYGTLDVARGDVVAIPVYYNDGNCYAKDTYGNYRIDGHTFIDLGLSVLWAETNIGAESATDYGKYYAWGEVTACGEAKDWGDYSVKTSYTWNTYKHGTSSSNMTKYNSKDKTTVLDNSDDAAYVNWGSSCRMPTDTEIEELINSDNCTWTWDADKKGHKVTSKIEGYTDNYIFIPASGQYYDSGYHYQGNTGNYWSRSLYQYYSAADLFFGSGSPSCLTHSRYIGQTIRPVAEKQAE